jgi:hypothetical protein
MNAEQGVSLQNALDTVEHLTHEEQIAVLDILQRRLLEQRRTEIAQNASAAAQAVREGSAAYGTIDDLKRDLE